MTDRILAVWNANTLLRDFVEGLVSATIGGAITGVLALSLDSATSKTIAMAALTGAIAAAIAFARRKLEATQKTP